MSGLIVTTYYTADYTRQIDAGSAEAQSLAVLRCGVNGDGRLTYFTLH